MVKEPLNSTTDYCKEIDNIYELRPWLDLSLKLPIGGAFQFIQRLRGEYRNLLFNGNTPNDFYPRARFKVGADYHIKTAGHLSEVADTHSGEDKSGWSIGVFLEWYFIKDFATGERFPNAREFTIELTKHLKKGNKLNFAYRREVFFSRERDVQEGMGHAFIIGYKI